MADNKNRWLRLDHLAYVHVSGADSLNFLQGQLSSDVRLVSETQAQISSYNNPKGRMLAVLHLLRDGPDLVLELHRSVAESVVRRLKMYVLRSKVVFKESAAGLGLLGPDAPRALDRLGLPCPVQPLQSCRQGDILITRRWGELPRFSLTAAPERLAPLRSLLSTEALEGEETDWRRADIEAGVPTVYPQTQEHFVPQWCNLDRLGGISFSKGCYTGQEIVARIHYLGEVKRRMHTVKLDDCAGLSVGSQTPEGEIVDLTALPAGGCRGLVVQKS